MASLRLNYWFYAHSTGVEWRPKIPLTHVSSLLNLLSSTLIRNYFTFFSKGHRKSLDQAVNCNDLQWTGAAMHPTALFLNLFSKSVSCPIPRYPHPFSHTHTLSLYPFFFLSLSRFFPSLSILQFVSSRSFPPTPHIHCLTFLPHTHHHLSWNLSL